MKNLLGCLVTANSVFTRSIFISFYAHVRLAYENGAELYIIKSHNLEKMKREIEAGIFFPMSSSILNYT